ncbi:MAG: hypothetical protein P8Y44_12665 [Acidobacteriota bacterium]
MSQPPPTEPDGVPFSPQPPESSTAGCSRVGLIGCGISTLLLGAAAILFLLKAEDLFAWAMENFRTEILESLPHDLDEEQAVRLRLAFDDAIAAVKEGAADPRALRNMQEELRRSMWEAGETLTEEQVSALIEALEQVGAGVRAGPEDDASSADP